MTAIAPRGPGGRSLAIALLTLGMLSFTLAGLGRLGAREGYIWAERVLDHPIALGLVGGLVVTVAVIGLTAGVVRVALSVLCVLATLAWAGWFWVASIFSPTPAHDRMQVTNDAGTLRTQVLLTGIMDPVWMIRLDQTDPSPLSRFHIAGCIDGDALSLRSLHWNGSAVVAKTSAGSISIDVNAHGVAEGWRSSGPAQLDDC